MRGNAHVRFGSAGRGNGRLERDTPRPGPILTPRSRLHPRAPASRDLPTEPAADPDVVATD